MAAKNMAAFGIYFDRASVENAVDALKDEGYYGADISVLLPQTTATLDFAHDNQTKAPEGVTTGAGTVFSAVVGMGIPEDEATQYEGRVKDGGILLSVICEDSEWTERAEQILEETAAKYVSTGKSHSDAPTGKRSNVLPFPGRIREATPIDPIIPRDRKTN